jgi:hypothetical protein
MEAQSPKPKKEKEPHQAQHNQVFIMNLPEDVTEKMVRCLSVTYFIV